MKGNNRRAAAAASTASSIGIVVAVIVASFLSAAVYQYVHVRTNTISGTKISIHELVRAPVPAAAAVAGPSLRASASGRDRTAAASTPTPTSPAPPPASASAPSPSPGRGVIPLVIYQTYNLKHLIPRKVEENMRTFAPQYARHVYNDSECADFIRTHFHGAVHRTYTQVKGAHKADIFRYAVLYIHGGVYLDIKTELLTPLAAIIPDTVASKGPSSEATMFTALSGGPLKRSMYQGVIATPKGNPLFLHLIQDFVQSKKPIPDYSQSVKKMYEMIAEETQQTALHGGLNARKGSVTTISAAGSSQPRAAPASPPSKRVATDEVHRFNYFLFEEKERPVEECYDGADKYNSCYFVFRGGERVMKTRYADYPWHAGPNVTRERRFPILFDMNKYIHPLIS